MTSRAITPPFPRGRRPSSAQTRHSSRTRNRTSPPENLSRDGDDERRLGEADLRRIRVVRGPGSGHGDRLLGQPAPGRPPLLPGALAAGDPPLGTPPTRVTRRHRAVLTRFERDRLELAVVRWEHVRLARHLRGRALTLRQAQRQPLEGAGELRVGRVVGGERRRLERREKLVPHQVQHRLHVPHPGSDGDDRVLFGQARCNTARTPRHPDTPHCRHRQN